MRLFGRYRKEAEEAEARATMKALDETVNGPGEPKKWTISLMCHKILMIQDPVNKARFICTKCNAVLNISTERAPDPDKL